MGDKKQIEQQEYQFITEKRKKRPLDKKRILIRIISTIVLGVIFGMTACFVFVIMKPHIEKKIHTKPGETVTIPRDEYDEYEKEQNNGTSNLVSGTSIENVATSDAISNEEKEESKEEENKKESGQKTVYLTEIQSMGISEYEQLQKDIFKIGLDAEKSMVIVTGVTRDIDVFNESYEKQGSVSGLIIANNGQELLILTEKSIIEQASQICVTFTGNEVVGAHLKKYDQTTGMAVLGVDISEISEETMEKIKIATLGNSYVLSQGDLLVAIGTSAEEEYVVSMGAATSLKDTLSSVDKEYSIVTTNITGIGKENGFLLNSKGEFVGIILPEFIYSETEYVMALSMSECKGMIEKLSNNNVIPYFGIYGTNIIESLAKEYGFPVSYGIYVMTSITDSPGMIAGIQKGDLITEINGEEIRSMMQFSDKILSYSPGDVLHVKLHRSGVDEYKELELDVTLGEQLNE